MFDFAAQGALTVQIAGSTLTLPVERKFASIASVQTYCDAVLALNWVHAKWGGDPVRVRERRGQRFAHYERDTKTIAVAPRLGGDWGMRELVILHELAHHLCPASGHGPVFAELFLDLVTQVIGFEAGLLLRIAYADHNVDF